MKLRRTMVAPSVLSADYLNLKKELDAIKTAGADWIHFDVMDYDFVPNLTFGPKILSDITRHSDLFIDCHLMVCIKHCSIENYLQPFVDAKADSITLHYEALSNSQIIELIAWKKKHHLEIGLAIKPDTPWTAIEPFIKELDLVLVMSVEPGFGGQSFITSALAKIAALRKHIDEHGLSVLIEVDGGINAQTGKLCIEAGADVLVAGSYLFGHDDLEQRLAVLKDGK